jgi:D-alanyl-D-alanine carboxypeptidase
MHFSRGEMYIIVMLAIVSIAFAIFYTRIQEKLGLGDNGGNTIQIKVPEHISIDTSFFDNSEDNIQKNENNQVVPKKTIADEITSKAYLVGNINTGEIYIAKEERLPLPIASMSKLMTAYVALQVLSPTTTITVTDDNTKVYPDPSNLQADEKFTLEEIMYPLLLSSSNVASEAIATEYGRTDFLELMSSYAWEIGLPTSYFSDPSGLSEQNKASAMGFFELTAYIYNSKRELFDLTKTKYKEFSTTTDHGFHEIASTHPFVGDSRFLGGKTGRTPEAGDTMLTILNINNQPIAFIVLGGAYDKRKADTEKLISKFISTKK